jgi:Methyltransferase domain
MSRETIAETLPEILRPTPWQMSFGERSAIEGLLSTLRPGLSVEIGTAEGGSLARVAAHSRAVHSFDLVEPEPWVRKLKNVTVHTGDSHELLPRVLTRLADEGRNVDFALVDGDHSADGVRRDVEDLLSSPAIGRSVLVFHDTANEAVRAGLDSVPWERWSKVTLVDLDFVSGYLFREPLLHELWGGLGLVIVDATAGATGSPHQRKVFPAQKLLVSARDHLTGVDRCTRTGAQIAHLESELAQHRQWLESVQSSWSWRITAPLRAAKRAWSRSS